MLCQFLLYSKVTLFPYRSLQSIEQSSLCYTVGSYQLSILYIVVCIYQSQSPSLCPSLSPLVTISLFCISVTPFLFCKQIHLYHFFFQIPHISNMVFFFLCLLCQYFKIILSRRVSLKYLVWYYQSLNLDNQDELWYYSFQKCKNLMLGEFPGGPVVRTWSFHCHGGRLNPQLGN